MHPKSQFDEHNPLYKRSKFGAVGIRPFRRAVPLHFYSRCW